MHLFHNYGQISNHDLARNESKLNEEWDLRTLIEHLFKQIEKSATYTAKAGDTITDTKKIATAYNLIKMTQQFDNSCRSWRLKLRRQKKWNNFKNNFTLEYQAFKEDLDETEETFYQ